MRIKSFTLIEVMMASYIFMVVIMMVVSSFAMIKKSNENSDDARVVSSCARQVEDIFRSDIKSANFGSPFIKGIVLDETIYSLSSLPPSATSPYVGFATFEDPNDVDISKLTIKTFVKKSETLDPSPLTINSYYYAVGTVSIKTVLTPEADPRKNIPDGFDVTGIVNPTNPADAQRINSADCSATGVALDNISIQKESKSGSGSAASIYALKVKDKFFRAFADQATEKRYSDINIFVGNDEKTF